MSSIVLGPDDSEVDYQRRVPRGFLQHGGVLVVLRNGGEDGEDVVMDELVATTKGRVLCFFIGKCKLSLTEVGTGVV